MSEPLRVALIGFGKIAQGYASDANMQEMQYATHAQVLRDHPHFNWDSVVDVQKDRLTLATTEWGVTNVALNPHALAGRDAVNVLVLATPPDSVGRIEIIDAFPNLCAVFVEKPLGQDLESAQRFIAACLERHLLVQVNITRRGDATVQYLADGGLTARIGRVQVAFGIYGNGITNNGTHMVDLIRNLLGEVDFVQASANERGRFFEGPIPGDRNVTFELSLASGLSVAFAPIRFKYYRENALDLWGERGRLSYAHGGRSVHFRDVLAKGKLPASWEIDDGAGELLPPTTGDALYRLYSNLADAVFHGSPLLSPGSSAVRTAELIDAIVRSDVTGGSRIDCRIPTAMTS